MIEFTKDEISDEFMGHWNAFIDALPEGACAAPDLSAITARVTAMTRYVGRIERERSVMRIALRLFADTDLETVPPPMWRTVIGRLQQQAREALPKAAAPAPEPAEEDVSELEDELAGIIDAMPELWPPRKGAGR